MIDSTHTRPDAIPLIPLVDAFARAADNRGKAEALLKLCNVMMENKIGFPVLRKSFPSSALNRRMTELSALVTTFTDKRGHAYMPDDTRRQVIADETDSESLNRWGLLFVEVNMTALDRAVAHHYHATNEPRP